MKNEENDPLEKVAADIAEALGVTGSLAADKRHELTILKTQLGVLGKFFGGHENAPSYIAGIIAFISLLAMIGFLFSATQWKAAMLSSVLLGALGFMFGRGTKD